MKKLILIALLLSFGSLYAQNSKTKMSVKEFIIQTNNVDELKGFKWKKVKKFFKQTDKNDSIKIVIVLSYDSKNNSENKIQMKSMTSEIEGQTFELNKMIRKAKKMTKDMLDTENELKSMAK